MRVSLVLRELLLPVVSISALLLLMPLPASAEPFRMMVNHGIGWSPAGDFKTPKECEQEAAAYALQHKAQAGCAPLSQVLRWQNEVQFQQVASSCAADARVQLVVKPGTKATILGTTQQRFDFDRCMAERGQAVENSK
jgi:hypothetical protein